MPSFRVTLNEEDFRAIVPGLEANEGGPCSRY